MNEFPSDALVFLPEVVNSVKQVVTARLELFSDLRRARPASV